LALASEHSWCGAVLFVCAGVEDLFLGRKSGSVADATMMLYMVSALIWEDVSLEEGDGVAEASDLLSRVYSIVA
jgi:hypothetical protein